MLGHKLDGRMGYTKKRLIKSKTKNSLTNEDIGYIKDMKYLYQDFLKELISGKRQLELSQEYTHNYFLELLIMSDFDWTDKNKFNKYYLFCRKLERELIK